MSWPPSRPSLRAGLAAALLAACGDGGTGPGRTTVALTALTPTAFSSPNALPVDLPPSVKVTDPDDQKVAGASVRFAVLAGGGTISGGTLDNATGEQVVTSDANGVVSLASWTLGELTGDTMGTANVVVARLVANGIALDSLTFTATATGNTWSLRAPSPGVGSFGALAVIDGLLYVSGESGSGIYDPTTDSWGPLPSPAVGRIFAGGTALGGQFYLVGGLGNGPECVVFLVCTSVEAYDPGSGSWTTLAPMVEERIRPVVAALGGQLYVVAGVNGNGNVLSSAERYDPGTNSWSPIAAFPRSSDPLSGTVLGGRLYVVGEDRGPPPPPGESTFGAISVSVDIYDPATDSWSAGTPMQAALVTPGLLWTPVVTVFRGRLYVQGGVAGNGVATRTWLAAYDPGSDQWIPKADLPLAGLAVPQIGAGLAVVDEVLYAVGGYQDPDLMRAYAP